MKPVCVKCQRFFRMKKAGFYFTEGMLAGPGPAMPSTSEPEKWKPYKVWSGDLWRCAGCGFELVSGFGLAAVAEHYQTDFKAVHELLKADRLQVNDC